MQPRWRQYYRETARPAPASRNQAAIALGALLTDITLAALARDTQHVRNLVQDVETLEKTLGVIEQMRGRISRLPVLAEAGEWESLRREAEAAGVELGAALERVRDETLARLIAAGAWLRALHVDAEIRREDSGKAGPPAALTADFLLWLRGQWANVGEPVRNDRVLVLCERTINLLDECRQHEGPARDRNMVVADTLAEFMRQLHHL